MVIDHFQSPGPVDRTESFTHRFGRDRNPLRGRSLQKRQGTGGVIQLMTALQGAGQPVILQAQSMIGKTRGSLPLGAEVLIHTKHRGLPFLRHLFDRPPGLLVEPPQHDRHPLFDNAGLLERDRRERRPQIVLMIERDRRHRAGHGRDDVGSVEPAAQSHLQHSHVDPCLSKVLKGHRRRIFEKCGGEIRLAESLQLFGQLRHLRFRDHLAVHADPLPELHEMGRGIEPHPITGRLQHRSGHGCSGSFAIRAGDMEGPVPGLRHPESSHQCRHRLKAQLDAVLLQTIQIGHGRGIGHAVTRTDGRLAKMRHEPRKREVNRQVHRDCSHTGTAQTQALSQPGVQA